MRNALSRLPVGEELETLRLFLMSGKDIRVRRRGHTQRHHAEIGSVRLEADQLRSPFRIAVVRGPERARKPLGHDAVAIRLWSFLPSARLGTGIGISRISSSVLHL